MCFSSMLRWFRSLEAPCHHRLISGVPPGQGHRMALGRGVSIQFHPAPKRVVSEKAAWNSVSRVSTVPRRPYATRDTFTILPRRLPFQRLGSHRQYPAPPVLMSLITLITVKWQSPGRRQLDSQGPASQRHPWVHLSTNPCRRLTSVAMAIHHRPGRTRLVIAAASFMARAQQFRRPGGTPEISRWWQGALATRTTGSSLNTPSRPGGTPEMAPRLLWMSHYSTLLHARSTSDCLPPHSRTGCSRSFHPTHATQAYFSTEVR